MTLLGESVVTPCETVCVMRRERVKRADLDGWVFKETIGFGERKETKFGGDGFEGGFFY